MKRLLAMLLVMAMLVANVPALTVHAAEENEAGFAGGSGTAADPYLISTKEQLNNVRNYLSAHFKLTNDIEFTDADYTAGGAFYNDDLGWEPIGDNATEFTGTFDGNSYEIRNLKICRPTENYVGLFGYVYNGTIKNVYLTAVDIRGTNYVGAVCGYLHSYKDSYSDPSCAYVEFCYADGSVNGNDYVAGICGYMYGIEKNGTNRNYIYADTTIQECYNLANVTAVGNAGGITAYAVSRGCDILRCVNAGSILSEGNAGGILGYADGAITYEAVIGMGTVLRYNTRFDYCGVYDCLNKGSVSGDSAGGIVAIIQESSYTADMTHEVCNCYNVGTVSGNTIGAICTYPGSLPIKSCYFFVNSAADPDYTYGTSATSAKLATQSTFTGWDFSSVWTMKGDPQYAYPELQFFTLSGTAKVSGDVAYNSILSASESELSNKYGVEYIWQINGETVSQGEEYKVVAEDIGQTLTLKIVGNHPTNKGNLVSEEFTVSKTQQKSKPVVPQLLMVDDKSLEIATVSTQEYSIDGKNWQAAGKFENLDPNKEYTVYSRILENDLYLLGESSEVLKVTTDRRHMTGKVSIVGNPQYGQTLTADISGVLPEGATYSYEWRASGAVIGTGSTYTITENEIGKGIILVLKGLDDYIGTLASSSVAATKATVQDSNAPVIEEVTNTTVKLVEKPGYEYSLDKINWQDSPVFTGLSVATEYTFYQRAKETDTTFASKVSNGTKETTLKNTVAAPEKPVIEKITNTSVTLEMIDGYEYSMDGLTWQTSNVFNGLSPYTEYAFCQRIAETNIEYASAQSGYTVAITLKNAVAAPEAPTVKSATDSAVTLNPINGYEYSLDGSTWQKSNVFSGLNVLKTYTFYQRIAETNTDYASATSAGTSFKVKNIADVPAVPTLKEKTNSKISVVVKSGYEYSIDKTTWNTTGVFTGLQPNKTYTVYCRIPETDTHYASGISNALSVTTLKNTVAKPAAPTLSAKTGTSVTLTKVTGAEYSKDGKTWQSSNVFTGLSPNQTYTFYLRTAETSATYASEKSAGLTVTTPKNTVSAPAAPTLQSKTNNSVTLKAVSGCEYSLDGKTWQKSNTFTGLKANTTYKFYQRYAETSTVYVSKTSAALSVTTQKNSVSAPSAPIICDVSATVIVLQKADGCEYSIDGKTWQNSNTFTGLTANKEYVLYQRKAETNTTAASEKSSALRIKTLQKSACSIKPVSPVVAGYTSSSITLVARAGYEYRIGNGAWKTSPTFSGLSANTKYTVYQRIAESAGEYASAASAGVTVQTATAGGTTAATNYDRLRNYINSNGGTSSDGTKLIVDSTTTSGGMKVYFAVENKSSGIEFTLLTSQNKETKVEGHTKVELTRSSTSISVYNCMLYYRNGSYIDSASGTRSMNRSTYSKSTTYSFYESGSLISASDFSDNFNAAIKLLFTYWDNYIYSNLGFGLKGLGFLSYDGYGASVCDPLASHHTGGTETRGAYSATCTVNGYTGDTYCTSCGAKTKAGKSITCGGSHTYKNSCDKDCDKCGEERRIMHTYSGGCDEKCNVCNHARSALTKHTFNSKNTCSICNTSAEVAVTSKFWASGFVGKIGAGTKVSGFLNNLSEKKYVKVFSGNQEVSGDVAIGTGMVAKLMDGKTVKATATVIVTGDTNGDGKITITDMLAIKSHLLKKSSLSGATAKAADTNNDGGVSITDFIQIKASILGKGSITPH